MPRWLKCKIEKGMFSDELTVTVNSSAGEAIAVFVPKHAADRQKSLVRVNAFEERGKTIAVLPDAHHSIVDVSAADLQPA